MEHHGRTCICRWEPSFLFSFRSLWALLLLIGLMRVDEIMISGKGRLSEQVNADVLGCFSEERKRE